jgi:hypothetical protein
LNIAILLSSAAPAPVALGLPLRRHRAAGLLTKVAGPAAGGSGQARPCGQRPPRGARLWMTGRNRAHRVV